MQATKKNKLSNVFPIIFVFSLLAGLRSYSVGIDTVQYVDQFNAISLGRLEYAYGLEYTFRYICKFLLYINNSPTFLFLVFSFLTNSLIIIRLWDFRKISNFTMMVMCYYCIFYFYTFNIMRQMCGVAIIFFATRYLEKGNYLKYIVGVAIAYCFHTSSVIGLILFLTEFIEWSKLKKNQKKFLLIVLLIIPWGYRQIYLQIERYFHYLDNIKNRIGLMLVIKILIYIYFILVIILPNHKINNSSENKFRYNYVIYYGIGIVLTALGYFFPYMERIGIPFYLFEGCFWGRIIEITKNKDKIMYSLILGSILMFYLYGSLYFSGQGQLPYYFVWE